MKICMKYNCPVRQFYMQITPYCRGHICDCKVFSSFSHIGDRKSSPLTFQFIPMAVLYGVFLYMGISSLKGMQLVNRIMILLMPMKYQPDYTYLRHVPTRRVHLFTIIQVLCLALLWVVKTVKAISMLFPVMVGNS